MNNLLAILIPGSFIFLILIYGFIVVKRHFVDKKGFRGGTEAAALGSTLELLNKTKRNATEQIANQQEEQIEEIDGEKLKTQ